MLNSIPWRIEEKCRMSQQLTICHSFFQMNFLRNAGVPTEGFREEQLLNFEMGGGEVFFLLLS